MKHIAYIKTNPELSGRNSIPDGAICGNGDLAVILGNYRYGMRVYLSKVDIWYGVERYDSGGLKPLGYIDIAVNKALYDNYYVEQDMDAGELRCRFASGNKNCGITLYVNKGENSVVIRKTGNIDIEPILRVFDGDTDGRKGEFTRDGIHGIFRSFDGVECEYETHCFAALKKIGRGLFYAFAATNHDAVNPETLVAEKVRSADESYIASLKNEHDKLWRDFWNKSSFKISDEDFELSWYASQYYLAVCTGNKKFPPGLYANFITVEHPGWHSDYHLNYNYQAPFYAACSSNHVEFTDCYMTPLKEFMPKGRSFAERMGCGGVIYPVGIAPKGLCTELNPDMKYSFERLFLGQKNNQLHPADIPVFRWRATLDSDYAREYAYPYLKACLEFFEDYGEWENGRFCVCRDAAHEVPIYRDDFTTEKYKRYLNDKNNTVTLGLLNLCLRTGIDMAESLGVDEDKRRIWQNMLDNLADFKTFFRLGKRVYRYTEKGQMWNGNGDVGLQHVYPCGYVGLSSDEKDLKVARNTFRQKYRCFDDDNAVSSYFPMAARLGIEPRLITSKLRELNKKRRLPNLLYEYGGGCLEYCSIFACTLNEMALQSHQGVVRVFPDWDNEIDCEFNNLRADGAFLVSSSIHDGKVGKTVIYSEKGGTLRLIMPKNKFRYIYDSEEMFSSENSLTLEVRAGETVEIF